MIQITNCRKVQKGSLQAVVDVVIPTWKDFQIKGITIFEKGGQRWTSFPSEAYEKDGKKMFARRCGFMNQEDNKKFEEELLKAYDAMPKQPVPKKEFLYDSFF